MSAIGQVRTRPPAYEKPSTSTDSAPVHGEGRKPIEEIAENWLAGSGAGASGLATRPAAPQRLTSAQILDLAEEAVGAATAEISRLTKYRSQAVAAQDASLVSHYERDLLRAQELLASLTEEASGIRSALQPK
jgi:hypothetical protein